MRAAGGEAEAALAVLSPIPPPGLADELRLPSAGRSGLEREAGPTPNPNSDPDPDPNPDPDPDPDPNPDHTSTATYPYPYPYPYRNPAPNPIPHQAGARLLAGPLGATLPRAWSAGVWARWAEQLRGA